MGNFCGSYHWKTLSDFVTRIFQAADNAAKLALLTAPAPNQAKPGDFCVQANLNHQWFFLPSVSTPPVIGDWVAITPWEASLISVDPAIAQYPGDVTIQDVMDDTLSGVTGGTGNPLDIVANAGHSVKAGVLTAVAVGTVASLLRTIAGTGLQAGVTVNDHVITRVKRDKIGIAGTVGIAAHTQIQESRAMAGLPANAFIIGLQPGAAMPAGIGLGVGRNDGGGNVQVRYSNHTAGLVTVPADANFEAMFMLTAVI